jgi:riboflavin kinase/FMN adenylyltransferase
VTHSVVAIGLFDGVHRGHQALLEELVRWGTDLAAEPAVITFDPHPREILAGDAPPLVVSARHRVRLIRACGVRRVWVLRSDRELLGLSARDFLRRFVVEALGGAGLLVGFDHRLGSDRADLGVLRSIASDLGVTVRSAPPFLVDGAAVSSTAVRKAIVSGDLHRAERLLGRRVTILGRVVSGAGRGEGLGYPTANLAIEHEAMVPCGIYAGEARLDGRRFLAAISVGSSPTFGGPDAVAATGPYVEGRHVVEVHLLDFAGDLRGKELEVVVVRKLREEARFDSPEALIRQMDADVAAIRTEAGGA